MVVSHDPTSRWHTGPGTGVREGDGAAVLEGSDMTEKILAYQVVSARPAEVADEMVRWILDGEGCQTFACIKPHPYVGALAGPRVSAALAGILPDPAPGMSACRPPFPPMHTPEQSAPMHAAIRAARPDVLWVGRTAPRHFGAEIHGFLAYLMKCVVVGKPYRVIGYLGKHVRDNIHCADLVEAFRRFHEAPRRGKAYNMGGSRFSNCSMKEAVRQCEAIAEARR